jgi:transcriptional regulator with XRE-family HTH domain
MAKMPSMSDQPVQTLAQEGSWMSLQEAVQATGVSEKTLRRYVKKKALQSKRLGKLANSPLQVWITPEFAKDVNDDIPEEQDDLDVVDAESESIEDEYIEEDFSPEEKPRSNPSQEVEQIIKTIAEQFGNKLDEQKEVIFQLRHELQEKDTQLRLLPDLQKKLEEEEKLKDFETTALKKQIEELNKENAELKEAAEQSSKAASQKKNFWGWFTGK